MCRSRSAWLASTWLQSKRQDQLSCDEPGRFMRCSPRTQNVLHGVDRQVADAYKWCGSGPSRHRGRHWRRHSRRWCRITSGRAPPAKGGVVVVTAGVDHGVGFVPAWQKPGLAGFAPGKWEDSHPRKAVLAPKWLTSGDDARSSATTVCDLTRRSPHKTTHPQAP